MTFPPVDRHAYIKDFFVFVYKEVQKSSKKVAGFGLNSRKSLRKAKSLLRYFKAFWLQSGIAVLCSNLYTDSIGSGLDF